MFVIVGDTAAGMACRLPGQHGRGVRRVQLERVRGPVNGGGRRIRRIQPNRMGRGHRMDRGRLRHGQRRQGN